MLRDVIGGSQGTNGFEDWLNSEVLFFSLGRVYLTCWVLRQPLTLYNENMDKRRLEFEYSANMMEAVELLNKKDNGLSIP